MRKGIPAPKGRKVFLEKVVLPAQMVYQALKDRRAIPVLKDRPASKVLKGLRVSKDCLDYRDQVVLAKLEIKALLVRKANGGPKVHRGASDRKV